MDIVTIDGPAGAGKSTISRMVARNLGYNRLDTGAMYRAVAWLLNKEDVDITDSDTVSRICQTCDIRFDGERIIINESDVTDLIRTPEMDMLASRVSGIPVVRERLAGMQKEIGRRGRCVAEGRDMGTVVFPDARYKFFLTATPEERARRRKKQLEIAGEIVLYEIILKQIIERDRADSNRSMSPLKPASDAILVDSTSFSPSEVVDIILAEIKKKRDLT
jgi:cytidylate kinase